MSAEGPWLHGKDEIVRTGADAVQDGDGISVKRAVVLRQRDGNRFRAGLHSMIDADVCPEIFRFVRTAEVGGVAIRLRCHKPAADQMPGKPRREMSTNAEGGWMEITLIHQHAGG